MATPPAAPDDAQLVRRARRGDREAFERLIARHQARIHRLALRLSGNAADADEIVQNTCLQLLRKLRTFRGDARFTTWLYQVATNEALQLRRAARRARTESLERYLPEFNEAGRHRRIDVDFSAAARVEAAVERRDLSRAVFDALSRLPPRYRAAVVLRDLEELSSAEASRILGIDEPALRQRIHRARLMLRGFLGALAGKE